MLFDPRGRSAMPAEVTRGKTSAECGYSRNDPRVAIAALRTHLGLAEGHIASVHQILRELENELDDRESADAHDRAA